VSCGQFDGLALPVPRQQFGELTRRASADAYINPAYHDALKFTGDERAENWAMLPR
jgi:hypothetical protein